MATQPRKQQSQTSTPTEVQSPTGQDASILSQVHKEYDSAFQYINQKRIENLSRMRLYSNQRRDKELVGDTTLFTILQTVLTSLYDDQLSVEFIPGHPDDTDKVDFLNDVAVYDNAKMDKDQFDYDLDWYTLFWGAGFGDLSQWDPVNKIMCPSVIDNATFLIDPDCTLINGDKRGFGAARFWGREIVMTKDQMRAAKVYKNIDNLHRPQQDSSSLTAQDKQRRRDAQNLGTGIQLYGENENIPLLEWWTTVGGVKYLYTTDLNFQTVVREQKLKFQDKWPIEHRKLFPIPGDPFGVSVPDLIEDKQRARSVLQNLGLMHAKADLYPMYVYDRNSISPATDLSFQFNKWIPSDGPVTAAVQPLPKQPIGQLVSFIMDTIDQAGQKATAATSMQQGAQSESPRSANEMVRVYDQANSRLSTAAKVFSWSEKEFWFWWLRLYNAYFTSAHSKFVRIEGPFGVKFEKATGEDFELEDDPDIRIESKVLSDAKNSDAKNDFIAFNNIIAQDQSVNRRYWNKKGAKTFGLATSEVNRLYPETADELKAEQENTQLDKNKIVKIDINDDHNAHLLIHAKADDTKAAIVHIEAHKKAIMLQRKQAANTAPPTPPPMQPGSMPLGVQQTPNQPGQGSAPAAVAPQPFSVQQ